MRRALVLGALGLAGCATRMALPRPVAPVRAVARNRWARVPAPLPARDVALAPLRTYTLSNGVPLWMLTARGDEPLTVLFASRDARSYDERVPAGLGRLSLRLALEGTQTRPGPALAAERFRHGVQLEATQNTYSGGLQTTGPWDERGYQLALLRDALRAPALAPADFELLRREQLRERVGSVGDPDEYALGLLWQSLFSARHPYGLPTMGNGAELRAFNVASVQTWLAWNVQLRSGLLLATGVRNPEVFAGEVEAAFGALSDSVPAPRPLVPQRAPQPPEARVQCFAGLAGAQTAVYMGWQFTLEPGEEGPFELVRAALGDVVLGRLNLNLREDRALTYGTHTQLFEGPHGSALFVHAQLADAADAAELVEVVRAEVARLAATPLPDAEFAQLRENLRRLLASDEHAPSRRAARLLRDWGRTGALAVRPQAWSLLDAATPATLRSLAGRTLGLATVQITATGTCAALSQALAERGSLPMLELFIPQYFTSTSLEDQVN